VLAADYQAAGRGRLDRTWVSPPRAGLTFSVLLRPSVPLLHWGWLPLMAGVAVSEAVGAQVGVAVALKWPNDLLVGRGADRAAFAKAGGILAQTSGDAVVIGIGINVTTTADELPVPTATSLAIEGGDALDRTALLVAILQALDARYAQWADCGGDAEACGLAAAYRTACATLGQQVAVTGTDGRTLRGTAVDVDGAGRLLVRTAGGDEVVGAGDVQHVRPVEPPAKPLA
jgi:BirA family transcriptional regulator, biotin operon repressor / biotin---[acetyl-CoA-carboxylase] ligase